MSYLVSLRWLRSVHILSMQQGTKRSSSTALPPTKPQMIEGTVTVGLEGYVSEWSGDGPIMVETLVKENGLRLWWD